MSKEAIVERILSDAGAEAEAIIKDAEEKAAAVVAAASSRAEKGRRDSEAEVKVKTGSIFERKAATARLDCAKILLSEKRRVIDTIYKEALDKLVALSEEECLALTDKLLKEYAESGDEIFFAENYSYAGAAARLPVMAVNLLPPICCNIVFAIISFVFRGLCVGGADTANLFKILASRQWVSAVAATPSHIPYCTRS